MKTTSTARPGLIIGGLIAALALPSAGFAGDLLHRPLSLVEQPETPTPPPPPQPPADLHSGQTPPALDPDSPRPWLVQVRPWVWYVGPSGDLKLPLAAGASLASVETDIADLNADSTRLRPAGDLDIAADNLLFSFSGASYELSRSSQRASQDLSLAGVGINAGDTFDFDFEFSTFELTLGYRFIHHDFQAQSERPEDAVPVVVSLYGLVGGRAYDLAFDFRSATQSASYDELLGEPMIGARVIAEFTRQFSIDVLCTVGYLPGDPETFSVDVRAGFSWMPHPNIGWQIGYRQLAFDLQDGEGDGEFSYDGRLAGLFTGLVLRY